MRWFLHFRVFIIITLAVMLITAAVIFSTLRAVLPYATGYKNEIQQQVSKQLGLPVEINTIDAAIHWFSPRLKLIGVSIYDDKDKVPLFHFKEAFLGLDVAASIMRGELIVSDVGLIGADISIEKLNDTDWLVQGIKFTSEEDSSGLPDQFIYMIQNSDYLLHDSNIYYKDHTGEQLELSLLNVNINVENSFYNHDITFSMNLPDEFGNSIAVVANLQGDFDEFDGEIFVEATRVKVRQWNKKFKLFEDYQADAVLDVDLWAEIDDNVIHEFFTRVVADNLSIKNKLTSKRWYTPHLSGNVRYVLDGEYGNLSVSDFSFGDSKQPAWGRKINLLAKEDEEDYSLSVDFLRVSDLVDIAEVFLSREQLEDLKGFKASQLTSDIYNLDVLLPKPVDPLIKPVTLDVGVAEELVIEEGAKAQNDGDPDETDTSPGDTAMGDAASLVAKDSKSARGRMAARSSSRAAANEAGTGREEIEAEETEVVDEGNTVPYVQRLFNETLASATLSDVSLQNREKGISISGLDLSVSYDSGQLELAFASEGTRVELDKMFRDPLVARTIQGVVLIQPDIESLVDEEVAGHTDEYTGEPDGEPGAKDDGTATVKAAVPDAVNSKSPFSLQQMSWKVSTEQLQLKTDHINTFSRFDVAISAEDGVFVDMQTNYYDGKGKYATRYLPVSVMSPKLVKWLDMAIIDGYIPDGSFVLHGRLDGYPYRDDSGVFQVLFTPENVELSFLDEWPRLSGTSATVEFYNESLFVRDASSTSREVDLSNSYAEILDLANAHISISIEASAKNEDVQDYVWSSPLDDRLGGPLRLFQFEGESELSLKLEVPLKKGGDVAIEGHLNLVNTDIYYPVLGYELSSVNGVVDFTGDTIFADTLNAKVDGKPVVISALTKTNETGKHTIYHLDGPIDADYLLQRYDWVPPSWVSGASDWSIDIDVPRNKDDYLVRIKAASRMRGVEVNMSDQVFKAADRAVGIIADIDVLDNDGIHAEVSAHIDEAKDDPVKQIQLFAVRSDDLLWNFDIRSALVTGKGVFADGLDRSSEVKLDLEYIDLHALFVQEGGSSSNRLTPDMFPALYWKVKKLTWDDWTLFDVVLETAVHDHGMLINKLSLNGPAMAFDAQGTWLRSWRGAHETTISGDISSTQCGDSLEGLGFQRSIDRCRYKANFESRWPDVPYVISWANMKGSTSFTMSDGEILEVDPGAGGRLLGLLNIFKLANRLSLDFDDVTREGFAFDSIKGDFEFVDGDGSLKDFIISAPAADINMFGSINMVNKDYGLLMRVKPHTDTLTFAGGALLGGVVVGAGLALIQKIFDLGIIGHNVYSITGSWDDPVVEKIVERAPIDPIGGDDEDEF